jgi:hypothetical protein
VKYFLIATLFAVACTAGGCNVVSSRLLARNVNYQQGTVLDPSFMQSLRNGG